MNAQHWIYGMWSGEPSADSINPADGTLIGKFPDGGTTEANGAIAAARHVLERTTWGHDARLRQNVLLAWAGALEGEREALARVLTAENGKPIAQARGEIGSAISEVRYYAGLARHIPGHVLEPEPGTISTILREPAGVAAIIVPWNAPAVLLVRSLAPALAAGCTAVVKAAAQTTLLTAAMLRLFERTGLPAGAVNLVCETGYAASDRLVRSHDVDVVSFTGSTATGKKIMIAAADSVEKLSLELGGKSCCLVFDDVDTEAVANRLALAATIISGQQCTAARRILVREAIAPQMRGHLTAALAALRLGPGIEPDTQIGPLIDHPTRAAISALVERACDEADSVLLRGAMPTGAFARGAFLSPTLVEHSDPMPSSAKRRFSVRSPHSRPSRPKKRHWQKPTTPSSACPPACGRNKASVPCGLRGPCATAPSGSTTTTACLPKRRRATIGGADLDGSTGTMPWPTSPS
jgi:acyl-CoA reductase-like NAD-dependent aldehyde dehydrogenase